MKPQMGLDCDLACVKRGQFDADCFCERGENAWLNQIVEIQGFIQNNGDHFYSMGTMKRRAALEWVAISPTTRRIRPDEAGTLGVQPGMLYSNLR